MRLRGRHLLMTLFSVVVLSCFACGKKGPPFLSEYPAPPRVEGLRVIWEEGMVILQGTVKEENREEERITGCRVYSARVAVDNPPCETCPIDLKSFQDIQGKVVDGKTFECQIKKEREDGIVYFQVRLLGKGKAVGPPSDVVKIFERP